MIANIAEHRPITEKSMLLLLDYIKWKLAIVVEIAWKRTQLLNWMVQYTNRNYKFDWYYHLL